MACVITAREEAVTRHVARGHLVVDPWGRQIHQWPSWPCIAVYVIWYTRCCGVCLLWYVSLFVLVVVRACCGVCVSAGLRL